MSQTSLCLFSSYFDSDIIPSYIKYYLIELRNHVDDVIFITNKKKLSVYELKELEDIGIRTCFVKNKGFDFGMYYQALQQLDLTRYQELVLANDSCYLVNSLSPFFKWFRNSKVHMAGVLNSYQVAYHIQSYFLVFKQDGVGLVEKYFQQNKLLKKKSAVIDTYEIGLTAWFQSSGLEVASYFSSDGYSENRQLNPAIFGIRALILDGFPLVKRKLIDGGFTSSDHLFFARNGLVIRSDELKKIISDVNRDLPNDLFD